MNSSTDPIKIIINERNVNSSDIYLIHSGFINLKRSMCLHKMNFSDGTIQLFSMNDDSIFNKIRTNFGKFYKFRLINNSYI